MYDHKSILSGVLFLAVGLAASVLAKDYELGTALQMGPGYFPRILSIALSALGICAIGTGLINRSEIRIEKPNLVPLLLVLIGFFSFALLVDRAGFFIASFALIFFSCLPRIRRHTIEVLLLYVALTGFCYLTFVYWFGMSLHAFWWG